MKLMSTNTGMSFSSEREKWSQKIQNLVKSLTNNLKISSEVAKKLGFLSFADLAIIGP